MYFYVLYRDSTSITFCVVGACLGEALIPAAMGLVMDTTGPIGLPYSAVALGVTMCLVYGSYHMIMLRKYYQYQCQMVARSEVGLELGSAWDSARSNSAISPLFGDYARISMKHGSQSSNSQSGASQSSQSHSKYTPVISADELYEDVDVSFEQDH